MKEFKKLFENVTGSRIYRNSLPHGTDCLLDLHKRFGRDNFKVVFDIGANIGQSAIEYVTALPKAEIYSFEPVSSTYEELSSNVRSFSRVHPFKLGMGSAAGKATITVGDNSRTSSIVVAHNGGKLEEIDVDTVAGSAERHGIDLIDFMKIDTEGYDLQVLAGAEPLLERQKINIVISECEPAAKTGNFVSFQNLVEYMSRYDYHFFGAYEQQPEWSGNNSVLYWNALFVAGKLVTAGAKLH